MIKLTDATIRCMEEHYDVIGIESSLRGCVYFTDPDKSGLLIVRPDGIARIKGNEIKAFVREMVEIAEVWFNWREGGRKMNETAKLKSCPFCGGEARIEVIEPHTHTLTTFMPDYKGGAFIECKCGAAISGDTKDAAIAAWNKRAQDTEAKRRRTEQNPKPLTLDELIRMDGEPVWIEDKQDGGQWGLVDLNHKTLVWYEPPVQAMVLKDGNFYILREYEVYGENLQAYRTKPEGSGE